MKIASWNVNSIRARFIQFSNWLEANKDIDIILLQETKCTNEQFPLLMFEHMPYNIALNGQQARNGVAIFSKFPFENIKTNFDNDPDPTHARFIETQIVYNNKTLNIASVYVPNGESLESSKFIHKLKFLDALNDYIESKINNNENLIFGGDYNIARTNLDVYDAEKFKNSVGFSDIEHEKFEKIFNTGMIDSHRQISSNQDFSWWDYRGFSWRKNHGMRIDYILLSENLKNHIKNSYIHKEIRGEERPSDHVPIIVEINI